MRYRLYYFDGFGISLRKLFHNNREFQTLEEVEYYLSKKGPLSKYTKNIIMNNTILIMGKDYKKDWEIVKIIKPNE